MSDFLDGFESLLVPSSHLEAVKLEEINEKGQCIMSHQIRVRDVDGIRLFRFDPNNVDWFPYFSHLKGLREICDYLLFAERGERRYILLLELKLSSQSANSQLEASTVFAQYLIATARRISVFDEVVEVIKVRIVGGRPTTSYRQPSYENGCDYITYRLPVYFDVKTIIDVYNNNRHS